jgi:hypothetical protein
LRGGAAGQPEGYPTALQSRRQDHVENKLTHPAEL